MNKKIVFKEINKYLDGESPRRFGLRAGSRRLNGGTEEKKQRYWGR